MGLSPSRLLPSIFSLPSLLFSVPPRLRPLRVKKKAPRECGAWKKRLAARYFPALGGAVSSPRGPLTAVFGMGTGVSAPPWPPATIRPATERLAKAASRTSSEAHANARTAPRGARAGLTAHQNASAQAVACLPPRACRPGSLPGALRGLRPGGLIFGGAWRLDAFSAYPFAAWLPGRALRQDNRRTSGRPPPVLSY